MLTARKHHGADWYLAILQAHLARDIDTPASGPRDNNGIVGRVVAGAGARSGHDNRIDTGSRKDIDFWKEPICIDLAFYCAVRLTG